MSLKKCYQMLLLRKKKIEGQGNEDNFWETKNILQILNDYSLTVNRIKSTECVFTYWKSQKLIHPELFILSVVLAVKATQVERLFSSLNFIFSPLRSNLNKNLLEQTMVSGVICNTFFKKK